MYKYVVISITLSGVFRRNSNQIKSFIPSFELCSSFGLFRGQARSACL